MVGFAGFVAYGGYLAATRAEYSLGGGPGIVVTACLGAVAGYALTGTERGGDRSAEFVVLSGLVLLAFGLVAALGLVALDAVGVSPFGSVPSFVLPLVVLVSTLGAARYLAYGVRTTVHRRFAGR
ncbi:MAG: hypothetical protein ABEJ61_08365 [Haloferacaceae archaeon]